MRCPPDVNKEHFEEMLKMAPEGAVLYSTEKAGIWRDFTFLMKGNPSKESCLKVGDPFVVSLPRK